MEEQVADTGIARPSVVFTLVCPATIVEGKRVSGCGKGWQTENATEPCSTCGLVGVVRDRVLTIPLQTKAP